MDVCKGERRLFDEMQMGSLVARNRFVRAATYEGAADAAGRITPEIMRIYRELARGGVGTIVDAIEVSGTTFGKVKIAGPGGQHGLYASYAAKLAGRVGIPVILTGGNRLCAEMQELLDTTGITGFGLARPLASEPDLIARWERDASYEPRCVSCSRCFPAAGTNCVLDR